MKYRIVEFKTALEGTGNKFFVELGTVVRKRFFGLIKDIVWEKDVDEDLKPLGHKTIADAMVRVDQIKIQQPIYHNL